MPLTLIMLAFPSPNWQKAIRAAVPASSMPGLKLGRASLIRPNLYLSDWFTAHERKELVRLGITHVLSIIEQDPDIPDVVEEDHKLWIQVADRPDADILSHLEEATSFIANALLEENSKVLVSIILTSLWCCAALPNRMLTVPLVA